MYDFLISELNELYADLLRDRRFRHATAHAMFQEFRRIALEEMKVPLPVVNRYLHGRESPAKSANGYPC